MVSFMALGLYTTRQRAGVVGVGLRILIATAAAVAVASALFYLIPAVQIGRGVLGMAAVISAVAAVIIRVLAARVIDIQGMKKRVLVYGDSTQMAAFTRMRRRSDWAGYNLVGLVFHNGDTSDSLERPSTRLLMA